MIILCLFQTKTWNLYVISTIIKLVKNVAILIDLTLFSHIQEFEDETLAERLVGLTEMFPERVRNASTVAFQLGLQGVKKGYSFTRSAMWITTTSFVILILPVLFETEMAQMEQAQIQKQRQVP